MNRIAQVLFDDNPADKDLASDTLAGCPGPTQVRALADGEPAMAFLDRLGNYANQASPDLVSLALNLPRKDGRALRAEVRADPFPPTTPGVVFRTTRAGLEGVGSAALGANRCLSRPGNLHGFVSAVQSIPAFWFGCAYLLRKEDK